MVQKEIEGGAALLTVSAAEKSAICTNVSCVVLDVRIMIFTMFYIYR